MELISSSACRLVFACLISMVTAMTPTTCESMRFNNAKYIDQSPPFKIIYEDISTHVGDDRLYKLKVTVESTTERKLRGVVIQARYIGKDMNNDKAVGIFAEVKGYKKDCETVYGNGLSFEGSISDLKDTMDSQSFIWTAPQYIDTFGIEFRATVIDENHNVYENAKSLPVHEVYRTNQGPPPFNIDTKPCGRSKGCYRMPAECSPEYACDFLLSWKRVLDVVHFEMTAASKGWIAMGLSGDKKMNTPVANRIALVVYLRNTRVPHQGDDDVIECVYNETRQRYNLNPVEIRHSRNDFKSNTILKTKGLLTNQKAYLRNRRIRCSFTRPIAANAVLKSLEDEYYIFLAQGKVDNNGHKLRHNVQLYKFPHVTPSKYSLLENVDVTGRARYPLAKLHGIIMIIAWMMSASTAMLMAKYYKPMWPNHDMCKEKVWFALHRGCMSVTFVFTIIGVIVIFIHAGGYSTMPELPDKAHPILGIITTIFCIINPFISFFRCDPNSKRRPIFNWIHWFFGFIPTVLATPTMFIGVNLAKARVPAWTTWCLVIFALFHLIIDLMLMIHDMINTNKNQEREKEFMIRKKHDNRGDLYGKEMNPVGTRFKTRIFFLYVIVVSILGLLVIIGIATG